MSKFFLIFSFFFVNHSFSQQADKYILLKPDRVFDGETMQTGWVVLVKNNKIEQAGSMMFKLPAGTEVIELKGMTLLPGLIEGHSHLISSSL
jgi:imidazolonepropionase-like amidohydrolase